MGMAATFEHTGPIDRSATSRFFPVDFYRILFTDRAELWCDGSQTLKVRAPRGAWRCLTAPEIIAEGFTRSNGKGARGRPQIRYRHEVPIAPPVGLPELVLPLHPYLVGYLLGDGFLSGTPRIGAAPDEERPWEAMLPSGCRAVHYAGSFDYGLSRVPQGRHPPGFGDRENPVAHGLREIGLWGCLTREKFIPPMYLNGSVVQRWALLQGLNDSDGSARIGGTTFGNSSEKLVDGMVELILSLGGLAYKRTYGTPAIPFWHVGGQFDGSLGAPFRLQRKVAACGARTRPLRRCITMVERVRPPTSRVDKEGLGPFPGQASRDRPAPSPGHHGGTGAHPGGGSPPECGDRNAEVGHHAER
jgi:hypothetical protein